MPPELQTSTAVVQTFGTGLYAPQFPARSVCEDYNAICAPVITGFLSETGVDWFRICVTAIASGSFACAAEGRDCNQVLPSGALQFPTEVQTVTVTNVTGAVLRTSPNTMADAKPVRRQS
eukprot:9876-Heterococcus_DN1.PRE.2